MFKITVSMEPVAKGRPKFYHRGKYIGVYTPAKTREAERFIRAAVKAAWKMSPMQGPVAISLRFFMPRPKSMNKSASWEFHIKRPDLDNLEKAVCDALNELVWRDDSLICRKISGKEYGIPPRIEIIIAEAKNFKDLTYVESTRPTDSQTE